jgi:hypothetical protein
MRKLFQWWWPELGLWQFGRGIGRDRPWLLMGNGEWRRGKEGQWSGAKADLRSIGGDDTSHRDKDASRRDRFRMKMLSIQCGFFFYLILFCGHLYVWLVYKWKLRLYGCECQFCITTMKDLRQANLERRVCLVHNFRGWKDVIWWGSHVNGRWWVLCRGRQETERVGDAGLALF